MIARMSKVEIAGPRELLQDTLSLLHETGLFQIEPAATGFINKTERPYVEAFLQDEDAIAERYFLEELRARTDELFSYLPSVPLRELRIQPRTIIDSVNEILPEHIKTCREISAKKEELKKELSGLNKYIYFLDAAGSFLEENAAAPDIDFIGLTIKDTGSIELIRSLLKQYTENRFEFVTSNAPDGTIIGVAAIEKSFSENIKGILQERDIPELRLPASLKGMSFSEKLSALKKQTETVTASIEETTMQLDSFTLKWGAIYKNVREWAEEKLSVLKASASVFETKMCFIINGWMASANAGTLREKLNKAFSGRVILEELEIKEEDIDRIPVILRNPAYFRPFEIFTKILPLPQYSSYDPTPFIAVFFPVFFGMILGDAGYGAILAALSLILLRHAKQRKLLADISKILFLCSMNAIFFGLLYGEFLGDLGERLFGMYPLLIERRTAIMPMLYFSVTVGIVHIILGIFLGFITELKKRSTKTAIYRLLHIIFILCMLALFASLFGVFPALLTRPIVLAILILTPLILFTGGLLAPLEILKSIGNMISYARIMAIGLTSVLLAYTANRLAGLTGDVVVGVAAAALLHIINLILSVFSPAVHSLRLHYVEFFSKFIETGGEEFRPFKKKNKTLK